MSPLIFVIKLRQILHLHWSITITLSTKANLHLPFLMKQFQHEAMSTLHSHLSHANIQLCHRATSTLYLHWSHANIRFCHDIASTLHLHWSRTNIGLYNGAALAPVFRGNKVQTSRVHSTVASHQDFKDAIETLNMQGALIRTLKMQGDDNKTLKFQEAPIKTLKMQIDVDKSLKFQEAPIKTLKMQEKCCRDFDIACP